jgi:choline-glycine betaine transporter
MLRAYAWLTVLWGGTFVVRAVVTWLLYLQSEHDVTALGTVSLLLGLPVTAVEVVVTLWVVSRLHRHRCPEPGNPAA